VEAKRLPTSALKDSMVDTLKKLKLLINDRILTAAVVEELAAAMNIDINLARRLTNRQREILVILATAKDLTVKQLFEKLLNPPSERMIINELNQLKELDLIDSQGKAKNTIWGLKELIWKAVEISGSRFALLMK
jgi:predicted HTH transcriptional regulator